MSRQKPPRPYERVSSDLILDARLTEADKRVLLALELKAGESRLAVVTVPWLTGQTGLSQPAVSRALKKAGELGYVRSRDKDEKGRTRIHLRRTSRSWVYAYRWMTAAWSFWQVWAFLAIQADHRAGGGHNVRLYGKKRAGLISLCHLRRYTPGGKDWRAARMLLKEFIRELAKRRLIGIADLATSRRPAVCAVNRRRMAATAASHQAAASATVDPVYAEVRSDEAGGLCRGADVVGKNLSTNSSLPRVRDRRSLPLRPAPQTREGAAASGEEAGGRDGGGVQDHNHVPALDSGGGPGRREGVSEAAGASPPAAGPPTSSDVKENTKEGRDDLSDTVALLKDLESRCGLVRSKNLERYGEGPGYLYLAGAFQEAAADFPDGWSADDAAEAVGRLVPGLREPAWGLILLASHRGENGSGFLFRDRFVGMVKEATRHRRGDESHAAARHDPARQAEGWIDRGRMLLSQIAKDNPCARAAWDWFAALAVELYPDCASPHEKIGREVTQWAVDFSLLSAEQKGILTARYVAWHAAQPPPP